METAVIIASMVISGGVGGALENSMHGHAVSPSLRAGLVTGLVSGVFAVLTTFLLAAFGGGLS